MDTHALLIITHVVGTILGVGGATMIEIHLNMALKDGTMDDRDRAVLGVDFFVTRVGMVISFLTGLGFIVEYVLSNQLFRLENGVFWAKMAIFAIIIVNAYLLHKHKVSLYWGSAFSFVSWWAAMLLGMFLTQNVRILPAEPILSFCAVMITYAGIIVIAAALLHKIRERIKMRFEREHAEAPATKNTP